MLASIPASILNHKTTKNGIPSDSAKSRNALSDQLRARSELLADPDLDIATSDALPIGYLAKSHGGWSFAIPWMLVEHFPHGSVLTDFCNFAHRVKVGTSSWLCLSGTSARAGGIAEIGDIDFAEYVFDDETSAVDSYHEVLRRHDDIVFPVIAKVIAKGDGKKSVKCPFSQDEADQEQTDFLAVVRQMQTKIDFIGASDSFGHIPISNMIFPSDRGSFKEGLERSSFSFQEALMAEDAAGIERAWPLVDMIETLSYIRFLLGDAESYVAVRPVKAAKRISALVKLLHMPDKDVELFETLNSDYARDDAIKHRIADLKALAAICDPVDPRFSKQVTGVLDAINQVSVKMTMDEGDFGVQEIRCRTLVREVINDVRRTVAATDARLSKLINESL